MADKDIKIKIANTAQAIRDKKNVCQPDVWINLARGYPDSAAPIYPNNPKNPVAVPAASGCACVCVVPRYLDPQWHYF